MLGALVSVLSAICFSTSDILVRRGVVRAPVSHAAFVTVILGVPLFAVAALVSGQLFRAGDLSSSSYGLLAGAGLVHYVLGRYFNYAAISAIGAARAGPVQALSLPYSVLIALLFLDEEVTAAMVAGIALMLVGPALMVERQPSRPVAAAVAAIAPTSPPQPSAAVSALSGLAVGAHAVRLRQREGYLFAMASAMSYGSSPVLIRAALEGESGLSVLGGLVSYVAAAALLIASLLVPARRELLAALEPQSVRIFFGAGFFVFMAQMLRFIALSLSSVAVVTTLLRFGSVSTLALSWAFNRRIEVLNGRVVLGVLISIAGAVLMVA
ncbi:MAG TPA: DMT family transporter [Dehalococcoidia bacterium]|nr:DMT family transporter [Dehalococcoidia bacterium]